MDVVALGQFGVHNAVATLGTATTRDHLERLFRVVPKIVFCFDGDRAGRQAAWRALENALPVLNEGRQINFMFLPDGEDPDTLVRKEQQAGFETRVANAMSFSDYFFGELVETVDISTIDGRAQLVTLARPLLEKLPEGMLRHMMATRLAEIAKIDVSALAGLTVAARTAPRASPRPVAGRGNSPSTLRQAIQYLLHRPSLASQIEDWSVLNDLDQPGAPILRQLVELVRQNPQLSCGGIVEHWRAQGQNKEAEHLAKLAGQPINVSGDGLETEFRDVVKHLAKMSGEQRWEYLLSKLQMGSATDAEKNEFSELSSGGGRKS
jgi:DNA primase